MGLFSTQSWLMLRPWLLQGNEPVIVLVPWKTDIIWIVLASEVWTDLQRRRGSNQECLWAESPHSCTVRVALASSNWRSEKVSTVQYSIVWQFLLRPSFQLTISDLLHCDYMICTECHTFIHLSLVGWGSGEVSRESIQEDLRVPLQPRWVWTHWGSAAAMIRTKNTPEVRFNRDFPWSLTPQSPTLAWRRREWLLEGAGGRGRGQAACPPSSSCLKWVLGRSSVTCLERGPSRWAGWGRLSPLRASACWSAWWPPDSSAVPGSWSAGRRHSVENQRSEGHRLVLWWYRSQFGRLDGIIDGIITACYLL